MYGLFSSGNKLPADVGVVCPNAEDRMAAISFRDGFSEAGVVVDEDETKPLSVELPCPENGDIAELTGEAFSAITLSTIFLSQLVRRTLADPDSDPSKAASTSFACSTRRTHCTFAQSSSVSEATSYVLQRIIACYG